MKKNMSEVGFEPTPTFVDQNALGHFFWPKDLILESGALDHSAILTMVIRECKRDCSPSDSIWNKNMLQVRFELTTSASLAP